MSLTPHHTELVGDVKELTSVPKNLGHYNYTVPDTDYIHKFVWVE